MKDYKNIDNRYEFSPEMTPVRNSAINRMKSYYEREGTSGGEPDGKTPILDMFEKMKGKASFAEAFAAGIANSWIESEPVFYDGEIIVGVPRPIRPDGEHFSWGFKISDWVLDYTDYSKQKENIRDRVKKLGDWIFPLTYDHMHKDGIEFFGKEEYGALAGSLWSAGGYQGHTVPGYPKLLRLGIEGTLKEIAEAASKTDDDKKLELYNALTVLLKGFSEWIICYARKAEELSKTASNEKDRDRLQKIAKNCRAISKNKPENLYQAVQLTWFYALWDWVDCMGRMDQYLYPFMIKSIENGDVYSPEDSMGAIMLKMMEHGVHNITLGGIDPKTEADASNELTFMILQIGRNQHQPHPRLSIRVNEKSPRELLETAVAMWAEGMSDPTIVSDKTVINGLMEYGVAPQDARDFTMLGCQEIEIPGKSNFGCEDGLINLAKIFEYTINDGKCRFTGKQIGLHTGYLTDYSSTEQLLEAYEKQVDYLLPIFIKLCNLGAEIRSANLSKLVKMPFTDDCIAKGINLDGGGARYNFGVIETAGSSAVADSFTAIDKLVFTDKRVSMQELKDSIDSNFEGHEKTRQLLLNMAPKFGNDNDLADKYGKKILDSFWGKLKNYRSVRGDVFMGACSLLLGGIEYGENTWAMPDGRFKGDPLGNSIGPRTGADKNGVTAMLNSVSKLPLNMGVGGTTANVLLPKKLLSSDETRKNIADILLAYLMNGGQMAQITTADLEDMKDAQKNPEEHKDLIVRVGGFSIHFIELSPLAQNEVINRYSV